MKTSDIEFDYELMAKAMQHRDVRYLEGRIKESGVILPLYISRKARLVDGYFRLLCCLRLGITHVSVIVHKGRYNGTPLQSTAVTQ